MQHRRFSFVRSLLVAGVAALLLGGCTVPWQQKVGGLSVQMFDGSKVQVFANDLHLGQAPLRKTDMKPGTYQLRLVPEASAEAPYEAQIHIYPGSETSVLWGFSGEEAGGTGDIYELEPLAGSNRAELSAITVPEGASVSLNTTTYGLSPVILDEVEPGSYTLQLNAVGHVKKTTTVMIVEGYRLRVFSRLEKIESEPTQTSPSPPPVSTEVEPVSPSPTPQSRSTPAPLPSPQATLPQKPYVTITDTGTGWLRVRDQASSAGQEIGRVTVGASYPYKATLNGWFEIEYEAGKTGWITGQFANLVR